MQFFTVTDPTMRWVAILGALAVCGAVLFVLHLMPSSVKRAVVVAVTFLAGGIYVLDFLVPPNPATGQNFLAGSIKVLGQFAQVVLGFTILLGIYNLCRIHLGRVSRARQGWGYSLVFFVSFIAMLVASFWRDWSTWFPSASPPPAWIKAPGEGGVDLYTVLFQGLLRNLEATMFSILAFYIVSAAYRAFRIRSLEAGILMVTAVILMLGQVPIGVLMTSWIPAEGPLSGLRIENVSQWVLITINSPAQRAIGFGLGLGQLAMALRIWLSLERGTYFGGEE
jgi:hypothetical protein